MAVALVTTCESSVRGRDVLGGRQRFLTAPDCEVSFLKELPRDDTCSSVRCHLKGVVENVLAVQVSRTSRAVNECTI